MRAPSDAPAVKLVTGPVVKVRVRHPDWITCRQWLSGIGPCGAINPFGECYPIRCVRCGRSL